MSNNAFEEETSASLKHLKEKYGSRFFYRRFYDTQSYLKVSERAIATKQPADFYCILNGVTYFLECKSSRSNTSYNFDFIQEHQFEDMIEAKCAGVRSYFLINKRYVRKRGEMRCYAIDPELMLHLKNEYNLKRNKKSIKWHMLRDYAIEIERDTGNQCWLLDRIISPASGIGDVRNSDVIII